MSFREKAIAAYGSSVLREQDDKRTKAAVAELARFFHRLGLSSVVINSNPFKLDGLVFYVSELEDVDGPFGTELSVSRRCDYCQQNIVLLVDDSVSAARVGQWLLEPHLCEFAREEHKPVAGFTRSAQATPRTPIPNHSI